MICKLYCYRCCRVQQRNRDNRMRTNFKCQTIHVNSRCTTETAVDLYRWFVSISRSFQVSSLNMSATPSGYCSRNALFVQIKATRISDDVTNLWIPLEIVSLFIERKSWIFHEFHEFLHDYIGSSEIYF